MATLVDHDNDDTEDTPNVLLEDNAEETEEVTEAPEAAAEEDLPEKYQGKSAAELAKMHSSLEELLGRQSEEVGEMRKAFDRMVQQQIASQQTQQTTAPEPAEEVDFWTDPQKAISSTIENHPKLKQAEEQAQMMAKQQALATLQSQHPDMKQILNDPKFGEWIKASPVRSKLYLQADQQYDYDSANELFTLWKERQGVAAKQQQVAKADRQQEVKKASTGTARSNPEGGARRKTYRRRDIIELMNRDPKRYESMQDEIMKAYAEGRVK